MDTVSTDAGRAAVPPRKVLSLVGAGRSGSTILSSILSEVPGIFGAGELRWLWARDLPQQRLCGCGAAPAGCPVWAPTVERALGVPPAAQQGADAAAVLREIAEAQHLVAGWSRRRRLLTSPDEGPGDDPETKVVTRAAVSLLDALFEVTASRTIIDASKRPQEAALLAASGAFDHYVVHMVRDPRAVVHSWRRVKPLPAATGRTAMGTRSQRRTLMRWVENAVGAELLRRHVPADRWLFVRYEDFAAEPRATVRRVLDLLGEPGDPPFTSDDTVVLGPNHTLSGNPNRFTTGPVRIVPDHEWSQRLSRRDRTMIEATTLPFLLRYGYPVTARRAAARAGSPSGPR